MIKSKIEAAKEYHSYTPAMKTALKEAGLANDRQYSAAIGGKSAEGIKKILHGVREDKRSAIVAIAVGGSASGGNDKKTNYRQLGKETKKALLDQASADHAFLRAQKSKYSAEDYENLSRDAKELARVREARKESHLKSTRQIDAVGQDILHNYGGTVYEGTIHDEKKHEATPTNPIFDVNINL